MLKKKIVIGEKENKKCPTKVRLPTYMDLRKKSG
jgi:hypothetical protein